MPSGSRRKRPSKSAIPDMDKGLDGSTSIRHEEAASQSSHAPARWLKDAAMAAFPTQRANTSSWQRRATERTLATLGRPTSQLVQSPVAVEKVSFPEKQPQIWGWKMST